MNKSIMTYIITVFAALAWGLSFFATVVTLEYFDPISLLSLRWGIAALIFLVLYSTKIIKCDFKGKNKKMLLAAGLVQPCLYSIFETTGIGMTSTSESAIVIALIPIFTLLVSTMLYKRKITKVIVLAVSLAFLGIAICVYFSPNFSASGKIAGYFVLLGAVLCCAFYTNLINKLGEAYTPTEITFAISVMGGIFFTIMNFIFGDGLNTYYVFATNPEPMFGVIFLGVACSCFCYLAFNNILTKFSPIIVTNVFNNSVTVIGIISGVLFAGDPFGWYIVIGTGLTLTGISLTNRKAK
ncbi:MAG: DMT family transporter [Peptostreptococcaceae bacterium]|nr:DMT family transporter [Peptostreptococcaceae bacterium]